MLQRTHRHTHTTTHEKKMPEPKINFGVRNTIPESRGEGKPARKWKEMTDFLKRPAPVPNS